MAERTSPQRRGAAGITATALCLLLGATSAGAAHAAPGFAFDTRIAGGDRVSTAVAASEAAFPTTAGSVVVVDGDATVDGLTASYLAGTVDAPVLFSSRDAVPAATLEEIERLGADELFVAGGPAVVSQAVDQRGHGRRAGRGPAHRR